MFVAAPGNPCKRLRILQEASPVLIKRIIEEGVQASIQQPPSKPRILSKRWLKLRAAMDVVVTVRADQYRTWILR
ncbi:hypothetical protein SNOG_16260 [Parastagonospora nodorum SN15]|uniref:Uncharacterized protein n=1 Tax=Phaeosphaeria nodorum (strain SN15 / ATCC MYA-4574 / FGSC 10173) TaxID=321614 RepID=Q0TWE0_PHANO|nr:hypothetical protein SNOG_16260 [Parastagonospora nodorum SN15]EAT76444.1 hypothetical protein SNOG_16260 [Parastagonospora nodorum SN15]